MKINLKYKNKKIEIDVQKCGLFGMGRGLTFRFREKAKALLFDLCRKEFMGLTALFVFFPFVVLWLDDKNKIVEIKRIKPWTFHIQSKRSFVKLIEIPCNKKYEKVISKLVLVDDVRSKRLKSFRT